MKLNKNFTNVQQMSNRKRKIEYSEDKVIDFIKGQPFFYSCISASIYLNENQNMVINSDNLFDYIDQIMSFISKVFELFFHNFGLELNLYSGFTPTYFQKKGIIVEYSINIDELCDISNGANTEFTYFMENLHIFLDAMFDNSNPQYNGINASIINNEVISFKDSFCKLETSSMKKYMNEEGFENISFGDFENMKI